MKDFTMLPLLCSLQRPGSLLHELTDDDGPARNFNALEYFGQDSCLKDEPLSLKQGRTWERERGLGR